MSARNWLWLLHRRNRSLTTPRRPSYRPVVEALEARNLLNQAPIAQINGPYTVAEGATSVALSAAGSADPEGSSLTYQWDFDYDGNPADFHVDATGSSPSFPTSALPGGTTRTVALRVTDNGVLEGATVSPAALFTLNLATGAALATIGPIPTVGTANRLTEIVYDNTGNQEFAMFLDSGFTTFKLEKFNSATGAAISNVTVPGSFTGLEYVGTQLYGTMITANSGAGNAAKLMLLDPTTGTATPVGMNGGATGRTGPIAGLAYDPNSQIMYGIDGGSSAAHLLSIDLTSGVATDLGVIKNASDSSTMQGSSLRFGPDGNLYAGDNSNNLWRININTPGSSTKLGPTGAGGGALSSLAYVATPATSSIVTTTVTVQNTAPSLTGLSLTSSVSQGGQATLSGNISDPGTSDSFTLNVNWGDGSPAENFDYAANGATATPFSLNHNYVAAGNHTVSVSVNDAGGGSDSKTQGITVNDVAPTLSNVAVVTPINEGGSTTLSGTINDPGTQDSFTLTINWNDGSAAQQVKLAANGNTATPFSVNHTYADNGNPTISVGVDDGTGGTDSTTRSLVVNNVAPSLSNVAITSPINEHGTGTLTGNISDPGTQDSFTLTVNWGDGSAPQQFTYAAGTTSFSEDHTFLKNGALTVSLTLKDKDNGTTSTTVGITVNNVAPTVGGLTVATPIDEGSATTLSGTISDPGPQDRFTLLIRWGDGTTQNVVVSAAGSTTTPFSATHTYADNGPFAVSVTATDADGGTSPPAPVSVQVKNVAPTASLAITGTVTVGMPVQAVFQNVFDPSPTDTAAGFTYSYDFDNDGTFEVMSSSPSQSFTFHTAGSVTVHGRITDKDGGFTDVFTTVTVQPIRVFVAGTGAGTSPELKVYDTATGQQKLDIMAFGPNFTGGVRVATADVNGDGIPDIIAGAGPGGAPEVKVFDGMTGAQLYDFLAFSPTFTGGVFVAAGDANGDHMADLVVGADAGGAPEVKVFSLGVQTLDFMAYSPSFTGGVRVAVGDVNGDGFGDVITGAGRGGAPEVKVFSGRGGTPLLDFMAYNPLAVTGVSVAADHLAQGRAAIVTGSGSTSEVKRFEGANATADFYAFSPVLPIGVNVATADVNGDGRAELILSQGPGGTAEVKVLDSVTLAVLDDFFAFGSAGTGGVFIAEGR